MRHFGSDIRFAFRMLFSQPGFSAVAILTLAIGISVTTAVFSVIDTMYWRAFPGVTDPQRLVELETVAPEGGAVRGSWLDFREYRERLRPVAAVAAHTETTFIVGLPDQPKPVMGELVSGDYFTVLGVPAVLGRVFGAEETSDAPAAHPVAVISHRLWTAEFGATPQVLGRTIRVNRQNLTIIGVTPPAFRGVMGNLQSDLWAPFTMGVALGSIEPATFQDSILRNIYMFARLASGVTLDQASAALRPVAKAMEESDRKGHGGYTGIFEPMWRSRPHNRAAFLQPMLVLMAVSVLVLLIVCANVANLLLARSVGRMQEFGVRSALGASNWRLARQCTTEAFLLCLGGAVIGLPLAFWIMDAAILLFPKLARPNAALIEMNLHVLAFVLALCIFTAFASSIGAMLMVLRSGQSGPLREATRSASAGRQSNRLRAILVITEVALAQLVLIGAGVFYRQLSSLSSTDPGFTRNGVVLANFALSSGGYTVSELQSFCARLSERMASNPGIAAIAYADYAPLWATDGAYTRAFPEGFVPRNPEEEKVQRGSVSPGYFALLEVPVLEGRDFTDADVRESNPVIIVNQAFAARYYNSGSPIGRRVFFRKKWHTVVGLVRDHKYYGFSERVRPHVYQPFRQSYQLGMHLMVFIKTRGSTAAAISALRATAVSIDPNAASFTAAPLADYNALLLLPLKLASGVLAMLGIIAFLLAGIGLHGVISYSVSQRTRELGIRIALGARPREVLASVARQGLLLSTIGVAAGIGLAFVGMGVLSRVLAGITLFDPLTFAISSLFLLCITAVASSVPAIRATRVDPITALHSE